MRPFLRLLSWAGFVVLAIGAPSALRKSSLRLNCSDSVWFVLDEVATMDRIGQLESGMTKQRASGNPIVLGCHDLLQLEERTEKRERRRSRRKPTRISCSGPDQNARRCTSKR
jgi:Type IV secretion-system coupling protein DNA-binding domain